MTTVLNPACDAPYNRLANEYEKHGNKAKAQECLEYCLEHVHPYSGTVAYALGSLYQEQGHLVKAKQCFLTCLKADDGDIEAMMSVANVAGRLGERALERQYYEAALSSIGAPAKDMASACCNLGVSYQGQPQEVEYYRKAIEYVPDVFPPRYSLACALADQQQWKESVEAFRGALALPGFVAEP